MDTKTLTLKSSMREAMPKVAEFIDGMRAAFGQAYIDECIRRGRRREGRAWFFEAWENGHHIGEIER